MRREIPPLLSEPCNSGASAELDMSASGSVSEHDPRATPVAAPVIKPRIVTLVMEGVLSTNRKPATAIHKAQRTMRMFIKRTPDYE